MRKSSVSESELDETLQSLYEEGRYSEGEELCSDILKAVRPGCETAKLFLLLNLAAQDDEDKALDLLDELSDGTLREARKLLSFGQETEAEEIVCAGIEVHLNNPDRIQPELSGQRPLPSVGRSKALQRVIRKIRIYRHPSASKS